MMSKAYLLLLLLSVVGSEVIYDMASPNENVTGTLKIDDDGVVSYQVKLGSEIVIPFSRIGFELASGSYPESSLYDGWSMSGIMPFYRMPREEWRPVWGEQGVVQDYYNQLTIRATQSRPIRRQVMLNLRAYDIGIAFNMEFPEQEAVFEAPILADRSEFKVLGDHRAWWAPADYDTQDYNFVESDLSEIECLIDGAISSDATIQQGRPVGEATVQTPITLKTDNGIYINIHEAGGSTFPSMNLKYNSESKTFVAHLTPDSADGNSSSTSGILSGPVSTPWRSIMVTRDPAQMLTNYMIYNLNEETVISDTTWIQPVKSIGIWWEMVAGEKTWRYTDELDDVEIGTTDYSQVAPNHRHGATTERVLHYIDFATQHSFNAVCFEGWNEGWEDWIDTDKDVLFDFFKSYPDVQEDKIVNVAADRNVSLIKHHEVGGAIDDYKLHAAKAFLEAAEMGSYSAVKVGYHGGALRDGSLHTSQTTNLHYLSLIEEAARRQLSISFHGGLKPTGLSRTYPNLFSATVGRTNSHALLGISPAHATVLPWNHLIGAPIEYGAGIVDVRYFSEQHIGGGSLMKQVALLLVLYAPNQLIADTSDHLLSHLPLLSVVSLLPTTWEKSLYVEAEIGKYVTVARQAPVTGDWFIGGVSSTDRRILEISLGFLDKDTSYVATIFSDTTATDDHPESYSIDTTILHKDDIFTVVTAENGGFFCHLAKQSSNQNGCATAD